MKRMKTALFALVLSALLSSAGAGAQTLEVRRVGSDSLVRFLRANVTPDIFFLRDTADVADYDVKAQKDAFLDAAFDALRSKGYEVTRYDGAWYILSGIGFTTSLPADWFIDRTAGTVSGDLQRYMNEKNAIVTFQNKIYRIGEPDSGHRGKAVVTGTVRDVSSGEPLAGVSVYDGGNTAFASTDANGVYRISIPQGEQVLSFSGYSLEDVHLNLEVFDDGGLDVVMKDKVFSLKGATVTAEGNTHRSAQMGLEKVSVSRIKHVPVAFGEADVIKVVLTLPGVKSVGDASSGFNVRGGATDQNLILFNGNTIYNPNHLFGLFSAFNADVISDVELLKSSIPAEYGGRISSVLEVRGREGNRKKVEGSLGVGPLTGHFHLEGPLFSEKTSFILGARTTYSNWMLRLLPESSDFSGGGADFADANLGITHRFNGSNTLSLNAYWSNDRFSFSSGDNFRFSNMAASVEWRSNIGNRATLTVNAGADHYGYGLSSFAEGGAYDLSAAMNQAFLRARATNILGDNHTLTYGLSALFYDLHPGNYGPADEMSFAVSDTLATENALEGALHVSDSWKLSDKLLIDAGVRLSGFFTGKGGKVYGGPELRLSAKYSILDNLSFKAGFNSMRQYVHMISNTTVISPTDTWKLCDDEVAPQDGWQAADGLYWTIGQSGVDVQVESYYKKMNHCLDYRSGAVLSMNHHIAGDLVQTEGRAYGLEVMVKKPVGKLNGWVSYTWSRTLLRETEDRGILTINGGDWYPAPHDKPHEVKLVGNYMITHRYSISANLDYSSGRPVTIPVSQYEYAGGTRLHYVNRNGYRIPDYFRLDLAMNIEPGHYLRQLTHCSLTLGVYNVTGRKNAYSVYFVTNEGREVQGKMLSVFAVPIPYVNLNLKF